MTQDFGEGAAAEFAETIIAASDALNSAETSKHVTRTMLENARQGFWNGSIPPYGYRTVDAEQRGQRLKKRLEIETREAEVVRLIFKLFEHGDGAKGPKQTATITNQDPIVRDTWELGAAGVWRSLTEPNGLKASILI